MNCAETRRQLLAPEEPPEALHSHLESCAPCRTEQEGLREVDRRVQRLGAYVLLAMPTLLVQPPAGKAG